MTTTGAAPVRGASTRRFCPWRTAALVALAWGLLLPFARAQAPDAAPAAGEPAAPTAVAEEGEAVVAEEPSQLPEEGVRYVPLGWLIFLVVATGLWVGTMGFVSRDTGELYLNQKAWNALSLAVGGVFLLLTFLLHALFLIPRFLGVLTVLIVYVVRRNRAVPEERKIFTPEHLSHVFRRTLAKLGIKIREPVGAAAAQPTEVRIVLTRKDGQTIDAVSDGVRGTPAQSEAVLAVKQIIEAAVRARATDVHIEPGSDEVNIRFRIDGILHPINPYPAHLGPPMVSVVKVLSDMDIAEKRKPQDGAFSGELDGRPLDFRAATSATVHGETLAVRILDRSRDLITLDQLGMSPRVRARFHAAINAPHGMVIVCGPTGAGKTTTLYAALMEMDVYQKNIMTIEDPIEYRLDNISQTAVNPKAGITFAGMLRSILRQDPNVIMVGEVRDAETARVALQAAMTGHLVLTTLHANDTVISLFRLLDLGVEPYLIASSLASILAQRLVRKLCAYCRVAYQPNPDSLAKMGVKVKEGQVLYKARGCQACQGTGYFGRTGIFELLEMTDPVRDMVRESPSIQAIKAEARKAGMRTLQEDGLLKVLQGVTSMKELVRVTK